MSKTFKLIAFFGLICLLSAGAGVFMCLEAIQLGGGKAFVLGTVGGWLIILAVYIAALFSEGGR